MTQVNVLLVDDNLTVRKTLNEWLSRIPGVNVVAQAASGSEALSELQRTRPDLVLTNVEMSGMTGFELSLRIKQMPGAPQVVLMSGCDTLPCYETLSQLAGADAHMHKTKIYDPLCRYLTTQFGTGAPNAAIPEAYVGRA